MSVVVEESIIKEETPEEIEAPESEEGNKGLNFAEFMDQLRTPEIPAVRQNFAAFMDKMKTEEEVQPEV